MFPPTLLLRGFLIVLMVVVLDITVSYSRFLFLRDFIFMLRTFEMEPFIMATMACI